MIKHKQQKILTEVEATIHALSHDGRGIARINGKTLFVHGAIPGEKVKCHITQHHRHYDEAVAIDVVIAAPERVTADCPHFGVCGGCSMQHIHITHQIQFKQQIVLEQLKHFGKVVPQTLLSPVIGEAWGYRRKARLGVRYVIKKNKVLVGFREKFNRGLAEIQQCLVLHPSIGTRMTALAELIASLSQYDHIAQVEVAIGDDAAALVFRNLNSLPEEDCVKLRNFGKATDLHIYLQPNLPEPLKKLWPEDHNDRLTYALPEYALTLRFHPLDFTQVNSEINQVMVKQAVSLLAPEPTDSLLDLFCGLGNFTLPLARYAKHIVGVEGSEGMVKRAEENALYNKITNTKFYAANLMGALENAPWLQQTYDKILLDPPRTGAKEIILYFSKLSAKKIIYISCNPATLARDAGELVHQQGYALTQVGVINMFPHTSHIESIAVFEKK
ncbi:MAG: rlmD [Gammaproteobacteria bacterium]|jgi:23S rRNA (uracil1939-C5)-methyltransferase|nr:rlmD [Gammaproteobacteria bacterium]